MILVNDEFHTIVSVGEFKLGFYYTEGLYYNDFRCTVHNEEHQQLIATVHDLDEALEVINLAVIRGFDFPFLHWEGTVGKRYKVKV